MGKYRISLVVILTSFSLLFSVTNYHYTTTVNVYENSGTPETITNDDVDVVGYAWFRDGIALNDTGAGPYTLTMATPLAVGGDIDLDGGTLVLDECLRLDGGAVSSTTSSFTLSGGGNTLQGITGSPIAGQGKTITINGDTVIDGGGFPLDVDSSTQFSISAGATLTLRNMTLTGMGDSLFSFASSTSELIFQNVTIILETGDDTGRTAVTWTFNTGLVGFFGTCFVRGPGIIKADSTGASDFAAMPIGPSSMLIFEQGATLAYDSTGTASPVIQLEDASSTLVLDTATVNVVGSGDTLQLLLGTVVIDNLLTIAGAGTLQFGDGSDVDNNVSVYLKPGAVIDTDSATGTVSLNDA